MGILTDRLQRAAEAAWELAGGLRAIDRTAEGLERRKPFGQDPKLTVQILGPDGRPVGGGGGPNAQFAAGGVGPGIAGLPPGQAGPGMPDLTGTSVVLGGGGDSAAAGGEGSTSGVRSPETNRDKLGAIITSLGIVPPAKEDWDRNGTGPGEFPGFIINTVLSLGKNAPTRFLVWCAGWLAYGGTDRLSSRSAAGAAATGSGAGGPWHDALRPGEVDPNTFFNQGAVDPNTFRQRGAVDPNTWYNQGRVGGSPSSLFNKSIADGTQKQVGLLDDVVKELRVLNRKIDTNTGNTGFRANGGI